VPTSRTTRRRPTLGQVLVAVGAFVLLLLFAALYYDAPNIAAMQYDTGASPLK
jgi:hypothetical protein